jgi:glycosyltransferase involved in cell wall biosynthesis
MKREAYSEDIDDRMRQILHQTDILVLPYRTLSSSIDTPLLLLEGMASLCAIVTRDQNHIREVYGDSLFLLKQNLANWKWQLQNQNMELILKKERDRLWRQNQLLSFRSSSVAHTLREALLDG